MLATRLLRNQLLPGSSHAKQQQRNAAANRLLWHRFSTTCAGAVRPQRLPAGLPAAQQAPWGRQCAGACHASGG